VISIALCLAEAIFSLILTYSNWSTIYKINNINHTYLCLNHIAHIPSFSCLGPLQISLLKKPVGSFIWSSHVCENLAYLGNVLGCALFCQVCDVVSFVEVWAPCINWVRSWVNFIPANRSVYNIWSRSSWPFLISSSGRWFLSITGKLKTTDIVRSLFEILGHE
jgi:hypothetical protein